MKGKGPRHERETIIRFDEESSEASVWTASGSVYKQLIKRGYCPTEDGRRSAKFEMPKRDIKLPRPKSEKRSQASRERAKALGTATFSSGARCRAMVQAPKWLDKGHGQDIEKEARKGP